MVCGTFARARLTAAQAAEVAQGYRDNDPPPIDVRTTVAGDGTFTVTAEFPPCPADTTHSSNTSHADQSPNSSQNSPGLSTVPVPPIAGSGSTSGFGALVAGGFFSSQPNDRSVPRSIRSNNPGALNISDWQRRRKGFVGVTESDGSADNNRTTIYRTPEHGVASWYHLLAMNYGFAARPSFRLQDLARHYAGIDSGPKVDTYVNGWTAKAGGTLSANTDIDLNSLSDALKLARAMFALEAGKPSPIHDEQINFAILNERANTLPP